MLFGTFCIIKLKIKQVKLNLKNKLDLKLPNDYYFLQYTLFNVNLLKSKTGFM